ncbi:MAG: CYTH and CHAD domain-containing protein [Micropepsaceae bacterium]
MSATVTTLLPEAGISRATSENRPLSEKASHAEIEVKLKASPHDFAQILGVLDQIADVMSSTHKGLLESRYFDTAQLGLMKKGLSLRVRMTEAGFIQTIKTVPQGLSGAFRRGEWESFTDSFSPDLGRFAAGDKVVGIGAFEPIFGTVFERTKCLVGFPKGARDASKIELALDEGYVHAKQHVERICEVELELVDGDPAHLFALALKLHDAVPMRIGDESKSARGYRLAGASERRGVKAGKLVFDEAVSLDEGIEGSFRACLSQMLASQAAAYEGADPGGVHQMRVALRRFRAALSVFEAFIEKETAASFKEQARWIAGALGPARDWDVFLSDILGPVEDAAPEDLTPEHLTYGPLRGAARKARQDGYRRVRSAIDSAAYTRFVLELAEWIERARWREGADSKQPAKLAGPLRVHADKFLDKRYRRVVKDGKKFEQLSRERKHRLRIALKKLRYAGDFFRSLYPKSSVKPFRRAMRDMLDELGHLNDVTVADRLTRELIAGAPGGLERRKMIKARKALLSWHKAQGRVSDNALNEHWKMFQSAPVYWGGQLQHPTSE